MFDVSHQGIDGKQSDCLPTVYTKCSGSSMSAVFYGRRKGLLSQEKISRLDMNIMDLPERNPMG